MNIIIDRFDILWTYFSKFLRIGQGLILLPLVLKYLPTDQIAIWAIFSTITALISVFDLGFSNVFSRNLTQILSGKVTEAYQINDEESFDSYSLKKLLIIMKKFYAYISLILLLLLASLGTFYLYSISEDVSNKFQLYISWAFLVGSAILSFYYNYLTIVLESKGLIKETQKISVYGIILAMIFSIIGIFYGLGLIAVTFSGFVSLIFSRYFLYKIYNNEIEPTIPRERLEFDLIYFKEIWSVTYKASIASISTIAIYRSSIIIISLFLPLKEAGAFAFSMNLVFILSEVSFMYFYSHLPQINSMVYKQNNAGLKKAFLSSIIMSIFSLSVGGCILIFFGNQVLKIIGSNMFLIQGLPLAFIIIIMVFDQIQNMSTFILFSENKLNYMWSYAISSILVILTTLLICQWSPSYLAVILPQLIIQLGFNYWYWPKKVFEKLEIKVADFKNYLPFMEF